MHTTIIEAWHIIVCFLTKNKAQIIKVLYMGGDDGGQGHSRTTFFIHE